jgi:hypothetical protein
MTPAKERSPGGGYRAQGGRAGVRRAVSVGPKGSVPVSVVTRVACQHNQRKPTTAASGYRNVYRLAGRWVAQVRVQGRKHYFGYDDDPAEAARVALDFRREHGLVE